MDKLFRSDDKLEVIYCDDDWSQIQGLKATGNMFKECYSLIGGQGSKCADLAGEIEYAHPDGGKTNPGYFTAFPGEFYGIYSSTGDTLTLYYDKKKIEREGCNWTLSIYKDLNGNVKTVIFDESVKDARPTSCYAWFASFTQLRRIQHLDYLNTSEVTDMSYMFNFCAHLTYLDLRTFDFNKVQKAFGLFAYCHNLRFILCNDDWSKTGNPVYDSGMFNSCNKLAGDHGTMFNADETRLGYARPDEGKDAPGYFSKEVPVAFYNVLNEGTGVMTFYYDNLLLERKGEIIPESTSGYEWEPRVLKVKTAVFDESVKEARLTTLSLLFSRFKHLTDIVHLDYLNTSEVTDMSYMFSECENLASLDVSSFNTGKVTDMSYMFSGCTQLTSLDVRNFDISKVTNMEWMFAVSTSLKTIYCNEDWSKNESIKSGAMFYVCIAIEGGAGTVYDNDHLRIEYARPDQGTSAP
jgi:surface protein